MLRFRICPNCQEETYSTKAYFCHRCGAELSSPPEIDLPEAGKVLEVKSEVKEKPSKKRTTVLAVAATLVVASLCAAAVYFYFQTNSLTLPGRQAGGRQASLPFQPSSKNETLVADVGFEVPNHPFSAKGLSEMVPADVDLYLESVDPELLLPSIVSTEDWSEVESFFSEQVKLTPAEAASFLEDEFAVVQESTASAFLAKTRDVDFLQQKITEVGSYEEWWAKIVEGVLVISNSPDLIHTIEEAQKKLTLNLSLTSGFVEARQKLPPTGQIFVYGKKRLEFIPEELKGEAFVIAKKDGGILITGL